MLKATTVKLRKFKGMTNYVVRVRVYNGGTGKYMYSQSTCIYRLYKEDALLDAINLMNDLNQDVKPIYRQEMSIA